MILRTEGVQLHTLAYPISGRYGARFRKGLPISSSIAESAVNQVVSSRMAKKQPHS